MARGTPLSTLLSMLKGELGYASTANTAVDAELTLLLSNTQKWLATEYRWPFLDDRWDVVVGPGSQFSTFPTVTDENETTAINLEVFPTVEVLWNNQYQPVEYGIGSEQYNTLNWQLLGQGSDPIQRWRMSSDSANDPNPNQFEVWPVPVSQQIVRFTGQRTLAILAAPTDLADLDDMLLVYAVASAKLSRNKQPDAELKLQMYQKRLALIKQSYPSKDVRRGLGNGNTWGKNRKLIGMKIIAVH